MSNPMLVTHRRDQGSRAAIVFVHGFLGEATKTWGDFPRFLAEEPALRGFDLLSIGYATSLFSYLPFWSSDPDLGVLARQLHTVLAHAPFAGYDRVALIAHSMGGLIAQRALLDSEDVARRTGFLILFGTPSGGLDSARRVSLIKRQVADMAKDGPFITALRRDWNERFGDPARRPFRLTVIGGDRDQFVPPESSLDPFDPADREVAHGDHTQIVKPEDAQDLSVRIVVGKLVGTAAPGGPWSAARVALERGQLQETIRRLEPHAAELDDAALVDLALAFEREGRPDDALRCLETHAADRTTDVLGTLAGRLKRRWLQARRAADGERAMALYGDAFARATAAGDHAQSYYLGINFAFLQLAFGRDRDAAEATATAVLRHCDAAAASYWQLATAAEARLHLGQHDAALRDYAAALRLGPDPRQVECTYQQAVRLVDEVGLPDAVAADLERCFRSGWGDA